MVGATSVNLNKSRHWDWGEQKGGTMAGMTYPHFKSLMQCLALCGLHASHRLFTLCLLHHILPSHAGHRRPSCNNSALSIDNDTVSQTSSRGDLQSISHELKCNYCSCVRQNNIHSLSNGQCSMHALYWPLLGSLVFFMGKEFRNSTKSRQKRDAAHNFCFVATRD